MKRRSDKSGLKVTGESKDAGYSDLTHEKITIRRYANAGKAVSGVGYKRKPEERKSESRSKK